jgi:hypothetical protein
MTKARVHKINNFSKKMRKYWLQRAKVCPKIPITYVRYWLKKTGVSVIDVNWYCLPQGALAKLIHEEICLAKKGKGRKG